MTREEFEAGKVFVATILRGINYTCAFNTNTQEMTVADKVSSPVSVRITDIKDAGFHWSRIILGELYKGHILFENCTIVEP